MTISKSFSESSDKADNAKLPLNLYQLKTISVLNLLDQSLKLVYPKPDSTNTCLLISHRSAIKELDDNWFR